MSLCYQIIHDYSKSASHNALWHPDRHLAAHYIAVYGLSLFVVLFLVLVNSV